MTLAKLHQSTFGSQKMWTFTGSFYQMYELKIYRGFMFNDNDNEEWCKIWTGIDWSVKNWHKEFNAFWLQHSKSSIICTLMGCFWRKYLMIELRNYRGVMFDGTQDLKENWLSLPEMTWEIWQIFTTARSKVCKFGLLLGPFIQSRKYMSLKFTEELYIMRMKNDTKSEEDLTCQFKTDMTNLTIFDPSTWKSRKFAL